MEPQPIVVNAAADREPVGWPSEQVATRGDVTWHLLFSRGLTPTDTLSAGLAEVPPGGSLQPHRHAEPELYFVVAGSGRLELDGEPRPLRAGDAVFIPGNALHGVRCTGDETLRFFYAFAVDAADEVEYHFPGEEGPA
jgi:quercetin dioxygenase-like cupin family protein